MAEATMQKLASMTLDELWTLHEEICSVLSIKLGAEKDQLDHRLAQINRHTQKRPYSKVFQKYRNPDDPSETWSGRGKQPNWLGKQLKKGKKTKDFLLIETVT
jgi:DNA-binding protein H-NS